MDDHAFQYAPDQGAPLPKSVGRFQVLGRPPSALPDSQATVFRALDPTTGQMVALKVMGNLFDSYAHSLMAALVGERDMEELRREARILSSLHHPNIVSIWETGEDPALGPFAVMEWVPGGDLRARLAEAVDGKLPLAEALHIALDVLAGLSAAHKAGVVHRDIKPGNILLDGLGGAKLADFGIAGDSVSPETLAGRGTPGYMAPEQEDPLQSDGVGPGVDIYAVGLVLFEMLTGGPAVPGQATAIALPQTPVAVVEAIERATRPDPERRFASAESMAEALSGRA